jgi:hypothetical protein
MYRTKDQVALEFIAEGKRRNITERGQVICIATGLVESNLTVYASEAVPESLGLPHDREHVDAMSVGPLQQQIVWQNNRWWWGDAKTCMDPTTSAGLFYDRLARMNYNDPNRTPGSFAADIQNPRSDLRWKYDARMAEAQAIYNRLTGNASPKISRAHADFWWSIAWPRDRKRYGYGGPWNRDNVNITTDCSGLVSNCLEALVRGPEGFDWDREPYSTESWRVLDYGQIGPFGTICVRSPDDIPKDAAVAIGLHHGGGGPDSHMGCTVFDPVRGQINVESSGDYGQRIGGPARGLYLPDGHTVWNFWNDFAYLPGPIEGDDELSAEAERMIKELYDEYKPGRKAPTRTFFGIDMEGVESPLGFLWNMDGNLDAQRITWAYLFNVNAAVEAVEHIAEHGVSPDSWAGKLLDAEGKAWLAEFGQQWCVGLMGFRAKLYALMERGDIK